MRWTAAAAALLLAGAVAASAAAHAFLDHASPPVGSTVASAPAMVTIWFTQEIEPAFSTVTVSDQAGGRVDLGNPRAVPGNPTALEVGLKPLPPGRYTVKWRAVSVDTHPTEGDFTFQIGGP